MSGNKTRHFPIERFYFGAVIQSGQPTGSPGRVASTPGITDEQVQECLRLARAAPPANPSSEMSSTLGLFRGEKVGYILMKAQRTSQGIPQILYWLIPGVALRWLSGNFSKFEALGIEDMPSFNRKYLDLPVVDLENPQPLDDSDQVELLYDLFLYCGDKIKNVEGLIAALIHGQGIAVLNAPMNLTKRMRFIQGLLCLLPAPARLSITWATNVDKAEDTFTQIKFMANDSRPPEHLIYDWQAGELLTDPPPDRYSKYIASQLRLDASLVVENTATIAQTAIWRAMRKDSLPQALYVASRRAAVDSAVQNNQPAERELVAAILRQDPTLSDDLRVLYAQHLLAFTLALDDQPEHVDVLPLVAAANRPVAEAVYRQFTHASEHERPLKVFEIIERWVTTVPQASAMPWHQIGHTALLRHLDALLKEEKNQPAIDFLDRVLKADRRLQIESLLPQIVNLVAPYAAKDGDLARVIFLLALEYLPSGSFQRMMAEAAFVKQLPRSLQQGIYFLQPEQRPSPPPGVLVNATTEINANYRLLLLGRLAEWALQIQRPYLIDSRAIDGILRAVQSGYGERFAPLIKYLAEEFSHPHKLRTLDTATLEVVPLLYFMTNRHDAGIRLLENYQFSVYSIEKLTEFTDTIGKAFLKVTLPAKELEQIFILMDKSKIRPEPRTRAYCAALIASNWDQSYRPLANRLTVLLENNPNLYKAAGIENLLKLLTFHAVSKDTNRIKETGTILLDVAVNLGERGVELVVKIWEALSADPEAAEHGLELVRDFIRRSDRELANKLPEMLAGKLGSSAGDKLQATFVMRLLLGDQSLVEWSSTVQQAANFLIDVAITYYEGKDRPPAHRLKQGLDSMSGGIDDRERNLIVTSLEFIAKSTFAIGGQRPRSKKTSELEMALLLNKALPQAGWDILVFMGGFFSDHKPARLDLTRAAPSYVLGHRSAIVLREESQAIARLLGNLLRAFPPNKPPKISLEAMQAEMKSLWASVSLYDQREIKPSLEKNLHHLAQVMQVLSENVKEKIFTNKQLEQGKQLPENGLEALRWVSGYFNRTHTK